MSLLPRKPRRRDRPPVDRVLLRAASLIALCAALIYVALTAAHGLPGQSQYRVRAVFSDAVDITPGSDVLIAGKRVGQVLSGTGSGQGSVLTLALSSAPPLPVDSTARIGYSSLLGALTVQLTPGHARRTIPNGGRIPLSRTSTAPELTDLLSTFDAPRRAELRTTLTQLGAGVVGRGEQLNETIATMPSVLTNLRSTSQAIISRPGAAARFFPYLATLPHAANPARQVIAEGFQPESQVLGAVAAESPDLGQLLDIAPGALSSLRAGLAEADPLLNQAHALANAVQQTIGPSRPALRATTALLDKARWPLARLRPVLQQAAATIPSVLTVTRTLSPIIPRARQTLTLPLPIFHELVVHGCDLLNFSSNWRSMLAYSPLGTPSSNAVGPENVFRVEVESSGTDEAYAGSPPPDRSQVDGYPAPCTSLTERSR